MEHYYEVIKTLFILKEAGKPEGPIYEKLSSWIEDYTVKDTFGQLELEFIWPNEELSPWAQDVQKMVKQFGVAKNASLNLWTWGLDEKKADWAETALHQALELCAQAALKLRCPDENVKKIVADYFPDLIEQVDFPKLAEKYDKVAKSLESEYIVFCPGDTSKSGRDSIAYVEEREDKLALEKHLPKKRPKNLIGIVKLNSKFFKEKTYNIVEASVTILHELTHLVLKTDDVLLNEDGQPIAEVKPEEAKALKSLPGCYGRKKCKELGKTNTFKALTNADSLALLACDIHLLETKSIDDILKLDQSSKDDGEADLFDDLAATVGVLAEEEK